MSPEGGPRGVLAQLLAPIDPAEFFANSWNRKALYIPGHPQKFAELAFSRAAFLAAAATNPHPPRFKAITPEGLPADPAPATQLLEAGATLCLTGVHELRPELARFAAAVQLATAVPGATFNAYLSPELGGFALHFDDHPVFILQIEGAKDWRYSMEPAMANPPGSFSSREQEQYRREFPWLDIQVPDEEQLVTASLRPGDALYLPAGCWHRGRAEGSSLGLTLRFGVVNFAGLVEHLLRERFYRGPEWRRRVPPSLAEKTVEEGVPAPVREYLADQLARFKALVAELSVDEFETAWLGQVHRMPHAPLGEGAVGPTDVLELAHAVPLRFREHRDASGEPGLELSLLGATLSLPVLMRPLLLELAGKTRFVAQDAAGWTGTRRRFRWADVQVLLLQLVRAGALRRAAS